MKYQIECNFTYGWDILNEEDIYPTKEEAQEAIDDLIKCTQEAYEKGDMSEAYNPNEFRIGKIKWIKK